jgi:hypothetical protein
MIWYRGCTFVMGWFFATNPLARKTEGRLQDNSISLMSKSDAGYLLFVAVMSFGLWGEAKLEKGFNSN